MSSTNVTVPSLLVEAAERFPDNESFVFPNSRETYSQLETAALRVAASLQALGIGEGDAVGALMPNCPDFVHVLFGTAMTGALFVPINSRLASPELAYVIPDAGIKVLFTTDIVDDHANYVSRLQAAFPGLQDAADVELELDGAPALKRAVLMGRGGVGGFLSKNEFVDLGEDVDLHEVRRAGLSVKPEAAYIMMYTSGTTSRPKGCPLSHESVVRLGVAVGEEAFQITENDRMWNPLPMFHVSAQAPMIGVINAGAAYVSTSHFEPGEAIDQIVDEDISIAFPAYPTLTGPILNHPKYGSETFARVRGLLTVGPPDLLRDYQSRLPHTAHVSCYGSTETGGIAVMGRLGDPLDERVTCGKPFEGIEVRIAEVGGSSDEQLPVGEAGALYMRGYNIFMGYHLDDQKTADSIDEDGWFATGDLASIDHEGNLTFRGRTKDMLKVGGENVGCLEVEAYLLGHPDVVIAAVVGLPDEKYGEVPVAFVELTAGSATSASDLHAFCLAGLAKYKVPRQIEIIDEWPMSATKIQKFRLLDRLR